MKSGVLLLAAALAIAPSHTSPQAAPRTAANSARISGTVLTMSEPGAPVRRAVVTVRQGAIARSAITDDNGRFVVDGLPAGRYEVVARRASFVDAAYGARRPGGDSVPVALADGEQLDGLTLRMARGAVITGTVRDGDGRALPGVDVRAIPSGTMLGLLFRREGAVTTDDRGAYRIHGLAPGRYQVMAVPPGDTPGTLEAPDTARVDAMLAELRRGSPAGGFVGPVTTPAGANPNPGAAPAAREPTFTYAPVFHPGTTVQPDAADVRLAAGEERRGVDIAMSLVPSVTVSGTIAGGGGPIEGGLQIMISGAGVRVPLTVSPPRLAQAPGADGRFRYENVTPGRYVVTARTRGASPTFAQTTVEVTGDDVAGVMLSLRPALAMTGRVQFEGGQPVVGPDDFPALRVSMQPVAGGGTGGGVALMNNTQFGHHIAAAAQAGEDGTFRLVGVLPDVYLPTFVDSSGVIPSGWWLRSVMYDGRDLLDEPLDIRDRDADDIVFMFTNRHSELAGTITSADGQPASGIDVVVLPAERAFWRQGARRIRITQPASDGSYTFTDLPAGSYHLAVVTDLDPADLEDPAFLDELIAAAQPVAVDDGAATRFDVRIAR